MTFRTAARFGVAGSAIPFARIAARLVVGSIIGQPIADMSFHWDPLAIVPAYLAPAAIFGFLLVLYRVSAGRTQPSRLSDAALAASVPTIAALAVDLRWRAVSNLISNMGQFRGVWPYSVSWLISGAVEPVAWLCFLVTFVRGKAPPLARSSRRAAAWLAAVLFVGGLWPMLNLVATLTDFWWIFPPRGARIYYTWNGVVQGSLGVLGWLLLLIFAVAAWRIRPAAEAPPAPSPAPSPN
jgi:hypothetical protein